MIAELANGTVLWLMKALGWKFRGERPPHRKYVLIGAPHTSNWDFLLTMALLAQFRIPLRFMVKHSVFWWPLGGFIRGLGGVSIDRRATGGWVDKTVSTLQKEEDIAIGILPEGTRKRVDCWKSGFYHIAHAAGVPIVMARIDGPQKTLTLGPSLLTTGDIETDMAAIAEFYRGALGVWPAGTGEVRLPSTGSTAR